MKLKQILLDGPPKDSCSACLGAVVFPCVLVLFLLSSCARVVPDEPQTDANTPAIGVTQAPLLRGATWSKSFGGGSTDHLARSVAVDTLGNIVVAGEFYGPGGSMDFGPGCALTAGGASSSFVAYINSNGVCLWAKALGASGSGNSASAKEVAFDLTDTTDHSLWVVGDFRGNISDFGCGPLSAGGGTHIFLTKFRGDGSCAPGWARQFGETTNYGNALAVDNLGNAVIAGEFTGRVDFTGLGGGLTSHPGPGSSIYVAKFDRNYVYQWANAYGRTQSQAATSVATDASDIVVTGWYQEPLDFGGPTLPRADLNGASMFLVKLRPDGTHRWSEGLGSSNDFLPSSVRVDAAGAIVVTGGFNGILDATGQPSCDRLSTHAASYDVFLAKFNSAGTCLWRKGFGDEHDQAGISLAFGPMGSIFLTGYTNGPFSFGDDSPLNAPGQDVFLAKFNQNGASFGSTTYRRLGDLGTLNQSGQGVAFDANNNSVLITGYFDGDIDFREETPNILSSPGRLDAFLAKFVNACDGTNCTGCCDASNICHTPSPSFCGVRGSACRACDNGLRCEPNEGPAGTCICDGSAPCASPPLNGCCQSRTGANACHVRDMQACGSASGGACSEVCDPFLADSCGGTGSPPSGHCQCGGQLQCALGYRCSSGHCVCNAATCDGCCDANGVCRGGTEATACGPVHGSCTDCQSLSAECVNRACRCLECPLGGAPPCHACTCADYSQCPPTGVPPSCHPCTCDDYGQCPAGGVPPSCHTCTCEDYQQCGSYPPYCYSCCDPCGGDECCPPHICHWSGDGPYCGD